MGKYKIPNIILIYILENKKTYIKTSRLVRDLKIVNNRIAGNHLREMAKLGLCERYSKGHKGTVWRIDRDKLRDFVKNHEEIRPCKFCGRNAVHKIAEDGSEWCECSECAERISGAYG